MAGDENFTRGRPTGPNASRKADGYERDPTRSGEQARVLMLWRHRFVAECRYARITYIAPGAT